MISQTDILRAIEILKSGGLVAFATETVYGLGADATNSSAVEKIFAAKRRPATNPLIVHVADVAIARRYTTAWPAAADRLAEHFWPGPLTIVLPKSSAIVSQVTAGGNTVGLRVPNHPLALKLLRAFNGVIAAPSANRANHISPTCAADVEAELGNRVDLILDGGRCEVGIESTVIDLTSDRPRILRPGGIAREQIESIIGPVDLFNGSVGSNVAAQSPGQQVRHYSPVAPTFWFDASNQPGTLAGIFLLLGSAVQLPGATIIQMPDDPADYARQLYHCLRAADQQHPQAIYVQLPGDEPRWAAVRDRLLRAAVRIS